MNYKQIQEDVIRKYHITIDSDSKCWRRTHAHVKERKVCKWRPKSSIACTFELLHEIGHIETTKSWMRRAESEYYATCWAIDRCDEYGISVPAKLLKEYQDYIDMEIDRGKRRGGKGYGDLSLAGYLRKRLEDIERDLEKLNSDLLNLKAYEDSLKDCRFKRGLYR